MRDIKIVAATLLQDGCWCCVPHRVLYVSHARICITCVFVLSFFSARPFCSSKEVTEGSTTSVSDASSSGENFAHNMWDLLLIFFTGG